jgi:BCD family chlorophyll transporter-like MFS transporter
MLRKQIQLGLIHVAVAMTLVPINSTLNRVMIKELMLSAALVALLASLPYLFAPIQVAIGSFADRHPVLGFRRTPYIAFGLVLCVIGVVMAPQAAYLMAEEFWEGVGLGVLAFGAWGMGFNFATVSYLSLATELSGEERRGRTIAIMWFMMIVSIIFTAIGISRMVEPYSVEAIYQAFWMVGSVALVLGVLGLLWLEPRSYGAGAPAADSHSWLLLARTVLDNRQARLFFWYLTILLAALLGQDILLEPFAGHAFHLTVQQTTRITSIWGGCFLVALLIAGALEKRVSKRSLAYLGGAGALMGFVLITLSGIIIDAPVFYAGVIVLGMGSGLATVSNLGIMLDMTTAEKVGLFIGAWGMSNAISRLLGSVLGGVLRDVITQFSQNILTGYVVVFAIEGLLILISLWMLGKIDVKAFRRQAEQSSLIERAAIAGDA